MRTLNTQQKRILTVWAKSKDFNYAQGNPIEELPMATFLRLEKVNDHEMIHQNINRFLNDLAAEDLYGGGPSIDFDFTV